MLISDSLLTWVWSSVSIITHGSSVFAGVQTSFCDYEDVWLEVIKRVDEFIALPIATDGKHINSIDFKEWVLIYVANLIICRYWRVGGLRGRSIVGWTRRHCRSPKICEFHLFGTRLYLLFQIYLVWCRPFYGLLGLCWHCNFLAESSTSASLSWSALPVMSIFPL